MTHHLARVVSALERNGCRPRRGRGESYRAHCPSLGHRQGDKKPSLGVTGLPDKVLLQCFVCGPAKTPAILERLGLTFKDLFAEGSQRFLSRPQSRRQVAVYPYDAVTGELVAEKIRDEPKQFRWRSPDPTHPDRWVGRKAPGVTVYRLPDLVDARTAVIVEGEKAVDCLVAQHITATCPPSGASAWTTTYTDAIWRAGVERVVVIPDNDSMGRRHAARVVHACHGYQPPSLQFTTTSTDPWATWPCAEASDPEVAPLWAAQLTLDDLPYHGDVCEWFEAGHTADELRALLMAAKDPDTIAQEKQARTQRLARDRQRRCRARKRRAREGKGTVTHKPN